MRIVHVITRMILGGAQENTLLTCDGLARRGHDVLLITGPTRGPEGELLAECGRRGIRVEEHRHLVRRLAPLLDAAAYRALRSRLRELRPDVVHTHSSKAGFLGRLAARSARVRAVVHTIHGLPFHAFQSALARRAFIWAERLAARRCDLIVSVADAMTRNAVAAGVAPAEKFVTVYSGMEIEPFLRARESRDGTRSRLGYRSADFVVTKLARLFDLKGHADLFRAAAAAMNPHPEMKLLLIGSGRLKGALERLAARLNLLDRVTFAGLVPPPEVPALLGASDLLVHTSLREGLPRAVPQALLAGTPVVAYDLDGTPEVVRNGQTGLLVSAGDIGGLSAAICRMASDRAFAARSAAAGRDLAADIFPAQRMVDSLERLYSGLLDRTSR